MRIEYEYPDKNLVRGIELDCIRTVEIDDPLTVPRVGEYAMVAGLRKVLRVTHYYGVVVSNGAEAVNEAYPSINQHPTGMYETVYVRLGEDLEKHRE